MINNQQFDNESLRLKHNSQINRIQRFKQLEFDFGPCLNEKKMMNQDHKGENNG